ncbi:hypothetical protein TSC_c19000 [Thermus scotoductus SA-01]|uniref:Uncharacterized protein n=1 Tax=Thermus scotoductus (strain ATCC 700910 / SA-01) TaxID=743525 RepID=E8PMH2_THESS|nr:hypothetical protein TSC_c19000 [Thermus scotoductus SA-01]
MSPGGKTPFCSPWGWPRGRGEGEVEGSSLPCASYTGMGYGWGGNKPQTVVSLRKVV